MTRRDVTQVVAVLRAFLSGLALGAGGHGGWLIWVTVIVFVGPAARAIADTHDPHPSTWPARREALRRVTRTRP